MDKLQGWPISSQNFQWTFFVSSLRLLAVSICSLLFVEIRGPSRGIVERLEPLQSVEAVREKIGIATRIFTPLQEILGRFSNVHPVTQHPDDSGKLTPNVQEATAVITGLIETKAKQGASANAGRVANEAIDVATQVHRTWHPSHTVDEMLTKGWLWWGRLKIINIKVA